MTNVPVILTIAGSDSGGGAGIQADLKTITVLGGYGASVITALTAQNTCGVWAIEAPSSEFVGQQLKAVLADLPVKAIKTGMLFSKPIIREVGKILAEVKAPVVVDPVCVSQSGDKLLQDDAICEFFTSIFPWATLVTPNLPEAELFTGIKRPEKNYQKVGEKFFECGAKAVLLKGGHAQGKDVVDVLMLASGQCLEFKSARIDKKNNHGTGCTLSAAIATYLGQGLELVESVKKARKFLQGALRFSYELGKGVGPVNHLFYLRKLEEKDKLRAELKAVRKELGLLPGIGQLIPEVRMNIVTALDFADSLEDVAGFNGRISVTQDGELLFGQIDFGASTHMAKVLLTAREFDCKLKWAINIRYSRQIIDAIARAGFELHWFDRKDEPEEVKQKEGSTLEWGVAKVFAENKSSQPRFIADPGEVGKEPMIRILAENRKELLDKIKTILLALKT